MGIEVKYKVQIYEREIKKIAPVKKYLILSKEDAGGREEILIIPVDVFLLLLKSS